MIKQSMSAMEGSDKTVENWVDSALKFQEKLWGSPDFALYPY